MKHMKKRMAAAVCTLTIAGSCLPFSASLPQTVVAADMYQTRDPFFNFNGAYNYYTSEHFQFIWGNSGDASKVTQEFLSANAVNLEECWDIYVNALGMTECAESVNENLRDGSSYKLNIYISGTGLDGMADDWAYMSYDREGYPYLFCCVGAMEYNPASWVMPHEFGHAITAHQLGWNSNKYSNTWWEALGNWFREQWIYRVSDKYGWTDDAYHGYGTDFFETYLKNMCFTSPFGRDYYSSWVLLQYLTENPDNLEGYGANFVRTMLQNGQNDEYPLAMIDRLAPADIKETLGHFAKRLATLDLENQTAYRKRLNDLLAQGAWNWQQIYTMLERVDGQENTYTVPTERAPQASGVNVVPLSIEDGSVAVTLNGCSPLESADWRGCIVIEKQNGETVYSDLIADGETVSMDVPGDAAAAYLTVVATPDASLYCPSGLHWHQDSDEFGETVQPFSSKYRYPYQVTITGASIRKRSLDGIQGHQHPNGGGFVADSAKVDDSVYVGPNACVIGSAAVSGNAVIDGYAMIAERAKVSGNAYVGDCAMVMGSAVVTDNAKVIESACIWDNYTLKDHAIAKGVAFCMANGTASGQAILDGDYYDDGSNTATKGTCCGWYGTQTYLDARPYTDGLYLNYSFDTDSSRVAADQYTSTYALPVGASWEASRTGANGVMTFDGKDDYLDIDDSLAYFRDSVEYQFALLWRGGAANQKLFYLGDAENYLYFTPENENGTAELVLKTASGTVSVPADAALTPGEWSVIRVQLQDNTLTLMIGGQTYTAQTDAEILDAVHLSDFDNDTVSVIGRGLDGGYFNGSLDFVRAYFKPVSAPEEIYTETEEIVDPDDPVAAPDDPVVDPVDQECGNVNCKDGVDVADAVLLARYTAQDPDAHISDQGLRNADADGNGTVDSADVSTILMYIAKIIAFD